MFEIFEFLADILDDIRWGKRYGFSSVLWKILLFICIFGTIIAFSKGYAIVGWLGTVGAIVCLFYIIRSTFQSIRKTREAEQLTQEKQ